MRIGILGGGQLAKMLAMAASPLGIDSLCLDPTADVSAKHCSTVITADYTDAKAIRDFAQQVDVITYENENIPSETLQLLSGEQLIPSPLAITTCQDRLLEKNLFNKLGIATTQFRAVDSLAALQRACHELQLPTLLKTCRFGYDGKGQFLIKNEQDIELAWKTLANNHLILEQFIHFDQEVSIIAVRGNQKQTVFYPLTQNYHQSGILRRSVASFNNVALQQQAERYASALLDHFAYQGVLAIEFFVVGDQLLANEMAPRVHNSGHWTIEGSTCSQFENHIRAVCGLPLGSTAAPGYTAMYNCIGTMPDMHDILAKPFCHYHDYQKQARAQRKMGHITVHCPDVDNFTQLCQQFDRQFGASNR